MPRYNVVGSDSWVWEFTESNLAEVELSEFEYEEAKKVVEAFGRLQALLESRLVGWR